METARNTLCSQHLSLRVFLAVVMLSVLGAGASSACTCPTQKDAPTEDEVSTRHLDRGRPALLAEVIYSETYRGGQRPGYSGSLMRRHLLVVHKSWNSTKRSFWVTTTTDSCGVHMRTAEPVLLLPHKEGAPLALYACGSQVLHAPERLMATMRPPDQETAWTRERWSRFSASVQSSYSRLRPGCEGETARFLVQAKGESRNSHRIRLSSLEATEGSHGRQGPTPFGVLVQQAGVDGYPLGAESSLATEPRCWLIYTLTPIESADPRAADGGASFTIATAPSSRHREFARASWRRSPIASGAKFEVTVERSPYGPFIQWPRTQAAIGPVVALSLARPYRLSHP